MKRFLWALVIPLMLAGCQAASVPPEKQPLPEGIILPTEPPDPAGFRQPSYGPNDPIPR